MKKKNNVLLIIIIFVTIILVINKFAQNDKENFCIDKMIDNNLTADNSKTVLLIHGYPEPIYEDSYLYSFFKDRGYNIIAPYLFTSEFKLTKEETKKFIEDKLNNKTPDVIVGVSMGGLIAPQIASDYSKAKLVLVATGPYVKTDIEILKAVTSIVSLLLSSNQYISIMTSNREQ